MVLDFTSDILEKLLFKKILVDNKWLNIVANVFDKRWFKNDNIKILISLTLKYYEKYNTNPSNKLLMLLANKYKEQHDDVDLASLNETINEVNNIDINIPEDILSDNLKEFIRRNAFYNALYDNADLLDKDPSNYDKVVDKCLEKFDKVQKITFNDTDLGMNYFNEDDMKRHWEFIMNPEAKIPTLWKGVDHYTNGGILRDGRLLFLLMAQPGLGKSVFMSNMAVNFLKQNLSVVVISLEMSQNVYGQRFDAHISEKNINKLKDSKDEAIQRIKDFYAKHPNSSLFIKEWAPKSIKSRDIECYLDNLKNNGYKFDVVIVDYLNLVLPNRKHDSMYLDGQVVSQELRALSYKFNVPVVSAVQSNTEGINSEKIDMQNVAESRGIVHTADFLAALMQNDVDRENGIIAMRILKNRLGGQVGKICKFQLDPLTLNLADITFDNIIEANDESAAVMKELIAKQSSAVEDISSL